MIKVELQIFLSKFTLPEVRRLGRKLDLKIPKKTNKANLINLIVSKVESAKILEKLNIPSNENLTSDDEALRIARESLKIQRKEYKIAIIGIIIAIIAIVVSICLYLFSTSENRVNNKNLNDNQFFSSTDSYNILLLPFGSSQECEKESVICEREVEARFNLMKRTNKDLDFEVQIFTGIDTKKRAFNHSKARIIGDSLNADLVVWGDYKSKCDWDETKIRLKWVSLSIEIPFADSIQNYLSINDISEIEEGEITGNIEEIVYFGLGLNAMTKSKFKEAYSILSEIESLDKIEYTSLYLFLAFCTDPLFEKNDFDIESSIENYSKVIELDSTNELAIISLFNRGKLYFEENLYNKAGIDFNKFLELVPEESIALRAIAHSYRGAIFISQGHFEEAEKDLLLSKNLNSDVASDHYFLLGSLYHNVMDLNKAEKNLTNAISLRNTISVYYFERGIVLNKLEKFKEAEADLTIALKLDSSLILAYYHRGIVNENLGWFEKAEADFDKTIDYYDSDGFGFAKRAQLFEKLERFDEAEVDLSRVIELEPNNSVGYVNKATFYKKQGRYQDALQVVNKAIELDSKNAENFNLRGQIHRLLDKDNATLVDLNRAIELEPNNEFYYTNRGSFFKKMELYEESVHDHTKAIKLNPNFSLAYYNRAASYDAMEFFENAIADLTKAIELDPNYYYAYIGRSKIYSLLGEDVKAKSDLNKANSLRIK